MEIININRQLSNGNKKIDIKDDLIVPDIKPDIISIIDSSCNLYICKVDKSNGSLRLEGNADTYISYMSSEGDTRVIITTSNFTTVIEDSKITENVLFKYQMNCNKLDVKILNERKISFECEIDLYYYVSDIQEIKMENEFEDIEELQMRKELINMNNCIGVGTSKAQVKENITVDSIDNVMDILKIEINISNNENKVSYNKVLAKADCNVEVIYLTEDNRISKCQSKMPIMSFVELENIKEEHKCEVTYQLRNELFKINSNDEHSISCQLDFEVICEAYEEKEVSVISDMYSLKNDVEFDSREVNLSSLSTNCAKNVDITEKIELEDVKKVISIDAKGKMKKSEILNGTLNIEGEIELKIYYEINSKLGLNVKNINLPFIEKIQGCTTNDIMISTLNKEFDLEDNILTVKIKEGLFGNNCKANNIKFVDNVAVRERIIPEDYNVIIYYVKPNDTLWKIAKNFKVSVDSLVRVNGIENPDLIHIGDKIFIIR